MKKNFNRIFFGFPLALVARKTKLPTVTVWRHATGVRKISAEIAILYYETLGIPLSELRPDLWPPEASALPPAKEDA